MSKNKRYSGIVEKQISRKTYIVKRNIDESSIKIHLKPVHQMNYLVLQIGTKVCFELIPPDNIEGRLLTETDFK